MRMGLQLCWGPWQHRSRRQASRGMWVFLAANGQPCNWISKETITAQGNCHLIPTMWGAQVRHLWKAHSRLDYSCPDLIMCSHTRQQRTVSSPSVLTLHQRGKCWVQERVWEKAGLTSSPLDCGSQRIDSEWVPEVSVGLHVITWTGLNRIHPNETALNNVSAWKMMESD